MNHLSDKRSLLRLAPFLALGLLVFASNANQDLPYLLRGYVTLLEIQVGLLAVFFGTRRLVKLGKNRS
jgi:hypothetical protein